MVPYGWSHIEPVKPGLIVPSNHSGPDKPETSEEIRRILSSTWKKENMLAPSDYEPPHLIRTPR